MRKYDGKSNTSAIDLISDMDRKMLFGTILLVAALTILVLGTAVARLDAQPSCYEDEVIVWTGSTHDKCVPISKFVPAMTDTVVVDLEYCNETTDGYLKCEIDPWAHVTGEDAR